MKKYEIPDELIQSFLSSMKVDLDKKGSYTKPEIDQYIYGSAEVVGLMCLCVFAKGDKELYEELKYPAMKLGSAFQKVNFLRDLKNDINDLDRNYFPDLEISNFNQETKNRIIKDIDSDFKASLSGIKKLPGNAKLPVLIAYYYYQCLLKKISNTKAEKLITTRISVHGFSKFVLFNKAYLAVKLRLI